MGVGMPQSLHLKAFGNLLRAAFGHIPYHVGSSVENKQWRDVDVRLMLPDDEYERMGFGDPRYPHYSAKWAATCMAFAALGQKMTGLPIDFQIQQTTLANKEHSGMRSALFTQFHTPEELAKAMAPATAQTEPTATEQ